MKLVRVRYGRKNTAVEDREYQIDGRGSVGCIKEFKKAFPKETFYIYEGDELMNTIKNEVQ